MSSLARGYLGLFAGKSPEVTIIVHTTYLESFVDMVERRRDRPVLTFLEDGTGDGVTWTYGELDREARRVAGQLREKVAPGAPVLLMAEPGLDYLAGFYGCIYAGAIAVPAYPPSPMHGRANQERLQAVARNAGVSVGLTTDATLPSLDGFDVDGKPLQWICISRDAPTPDVDAPLPSVGADDVVFLQYTSGSTGDPKGVIVTQGNLQANMQMIRAACDIRPGGVMVSWLPPYHDMGLIGTLLVPAASGMHTIFMPPAVFLRRPVRWLQAISRFEAYISPAPNFAFAACIEKVKEADLADLDLSSWKVAINGAEPVRASTVERFIERFGPCGFSPTALRPAYGLAETTLFATGASDTGSRILTVDSAALEEGTIRLASDSGERHRLVSSGPPAAGAQVRILGPTGVPLPDGQVGEIAVIGAHVTRGYWRNPEATAERFSGDTVRTGDLGCLFDGELVVTGRIKDVLIVRGRNYYPHDIEFTVEEAHPTFRRGCGVAFAVERDDHELVVAVQEVQLALLDDPAQVVEQVRRTVTATHGINLGAVLLTRPGTVPKTSSGKIRRSEARRMYEHDAFEPVWAWEARQRVDALEVGAG